MLGKSRLEDVLMLVVERPVSFTDFEPRGVPGFMSNIAHVFGCSENQTNRLLEAVDTLANDHHYRVGGRHPRWLWRKDTPFQVPSNRFSGVTA